MISLSIIEKNTPLYTVQPTFLVFNVFVNRNGSGDVIKLGELRNNRKYIQTTKETYVPSSSFFLFYVLPFSLAQTNAARTSILSLFFHSYSSILYSNYPIIFHLLEIWVFSCDWSCHRRPRYEIVLDLEEQNISNLLFSHFTWFSPTD